jgi:hypothetical protein
MLSPNGRLAGRAVRARPGQVEPGGGDTGLQYAVAVHGRLPGRFCRDRPKTYVALSLFENCLSIGLPARLEHAGHPNDQDVQKAADDQAEERGNQYPGG